MLKAYVFPARIAGTRLLADVEFTVNDKALKRETYDATAGLEKLRSDVVEELQILRRGARLYENKADIDAFVNQAGVITLPDEVPSSEPVPADPNVVAPEQPS